MSGQTLEEPRPRRRLLLAMLGTALLVFSFAALAVSASAYSVMSDSEEKAALIEMIEDWVPRAESFYCDETAEEIPEACTEFLSEGKTDGYYRAHGEGVEPARGNISIAIAYETLFASNPSKTEWGGVPTATLKNHVEQAIRYVTFTNARYGYGGTPWGGVPCVESHCLAPNYAAGLAFAAHLAWSELAGTTKTGVEAVVEQEASYHNEMGPLDATSEHLTRSDGEENAQVVGLLGAAHAFFPSLESSAGEWEAGAKDFAYNTLSREADEEDTHVLDGKKVSEWVTTVNLYDDYTMENHEFFHPVYLQGLYNDLSMAAVFYSMESLSIPQAFKFRTEEVWNEVISKLAWDDGDTIAPAGTDWVTHDYQHLQFLTYEDLKIEAPVAAVLASRSIEQLQSRQAATGNGSLYGMGELGYEAENMRTLAGTWWLHEEFGPTSTPSQGEYEAARDEVEGVHRFKNEYTVVNRTPNAFYSMSWDKKNAMGMIVPREEGSLLSDPVTMQNWPRSVIGDATSGTDSKYGCRCEEDFFSTAGKVDDPGGSDNRRFSMTSFDDGTGVLLDRGVGSAFEFAFEDYNPLFGNRPVYTSGGTATEDGALPGTWFDVDDRIGVITKGGSGQELETVLDNDGPEPERDLNNPKFLVKGSKGTGSGHRGALVLPLVNHTEMAALDPTVDIPTVPSTNWAALTGNVADGTGRFAVAYWGSGTSTGSITELQSPNGVPIPDRPFDVVVTGSKGSTEVELTGSGSTGEKVYFWATSSGSNTVTVHPISETLVKLTNGGSSNTVTVKYDGGVGSTATASVTLAAGTIAYAKAYGGGVAIITPSASSTSGSSVAANVLDNKTSTYWSSASTTLASPECVVLDMGTETTIGKVTMIPRAEHGPKNYKIQTSNSSTTCSSETGWATKKEITNSGDGTTKTITWTPNKARYVRIRVTAAYGTSPYNVGIKEFTPAPE